MKYNAFISYSHNDRDCAERLERELNNLAKSKGISSFRIFRDMTYSELNEDVGEGLQRNLRESEWLIVICSPSVNEHKGFNWVDFECDYFVNVLNRKKNIICFLSDRASFSEKISEYYPPSIRSYSQFLAADGRSKKDWFKNVVKVFFHIWGHIDGDKDEDKALAIILENDYSVLLRDSIDFYQKKEYQNAIDFLKNIPYSADVKSVEWYLLYALETGAAYRSFLGYPQNFIGKQVVSFKREGMYLCSTDGYNLIVTDFRTLQIMSCIKAHDGRLFATVSGRDMRRFVTWGKEDPILKYWQFVDGKVKCVWELPLQITYYPDTKPVFASFSENRNLLCLSHNSDRCAVVTGETVTIVDLLDSSKRIVHIPYRWNAELYPPNFNFISFSDDDQILFLANQDTIYSWEFEKTEECKQWLKRMPPASFPRATNINVCPVGLENGGIWSREVFWDSSAAAFVLCDKKNYFLLSLPNNILALWDLDCSENGGDFLGWNLQKLPHSWRYTGITDSLCAVSKKWIVYTDSKKRTIHLCTRLGEFVRDREICPRDKVPPLSEQELNLSAPYSPLLFDILNDRMNPGLYEGVGLEFVDEDCLVVECSKGRRFFWKIPENEWIPAESGDIDLKSEKVGKNYYITLDERRRIEMEKNELVFFRTSDNKLIARIPLPHEIKSFYFFKNDTLLIVIGRDRIYRYDIPGFPDTPDGFLEDLFLKRRLALCGRVS